MFWRYDRDTINIYTLNGNTYLLYVKKLEVTKSITIKKGEKIRRLIIIFVTTVFFFINISINKAIIKNSETRILNIDKIVTKEFVIGILNGIIFAIISAAVVQFWFKELDLSILIAVAMILNMIVAGLFGILVPVSLKKFNIDPALASSVFVTTITDVIGFLSFLGIGSIFFLN